MPDERFNVTLTTVDRNYWINAIKTVRGLVQDFSGMSSTDGFGLKEAKDLVDGVRDGTPRPLLLNVTKSDAQKVRRIFAKVNAKVRVEKVR